MTKKVKHTEENILGVYRDEASGKIVPYWEDNEPWHVRQWVNNWGKNVTSLTMAGAPRSVAPRKKSKGTKKSA